MLFDSILETGPRWEMVGHANLFYGWKINDAQIEVARSQWPGFNVIFHALGQPGEKELKRGTSWLRLHRNLFPFRIALVFGIQARVRCLQSFKLRGYNLV